MPFVCSSTNRIKSGIVMRIFHVRQEAFRMLPAGRLCIGLRQSFSCKVDYVAKLIIVHTFD